MKNEPKNKNRLSRRRFLKGIAAGALLLAGGAYFAKELSTGRPSLAYGL